MQIIIDAMPGQIKYTASTGDWRLIIKDGTFVLDPIATGELTYSSGINLDNLALLIIAAKADAIQRGVNWQGE
jgi:hypothetical protein